MNNRIFLWAVICAVTLGTGTLTTFEASAQDAGTVLTGGFNGPMGILAAPDGSIWVVDTGVGGEEEREFPNPWTYQMSAAKYGMTARVVRISEDGTQSEMALLPSIVTGPGEALGGGRLATIDDVVYATSGMWIAGAGSDPWPLMATIVKISDGQAVAIANTFPIENEQNPDGRIVETNPYGLAVGPDGKLWTTDSAANTLLKIDPKTGDIEIVAVFDAVPSPLPNPNHGDRMETDPVPTGLTFDQDGNAYVSLLPGFPFVPGSAKVVKVAPDGKVSDYGTGLTMPVDLRTGPDGRMYAVSLGRFTEEGPVPDSGAIVRVGEGDTSEELITGLSFPTSIDFNADGDAYVTINGIGEPGTGQVVVFERLAAGE